MKLERLEGAEATYSPEDNKLRLYPLERLETELYGYLREKGFKWAPKQELFVAPMWTPQRRDILLSLCEEIGDEQKTMQERAEERAERFKVYQGKRANDAEQAYQESEALAGQVPMGQPILVGHHSERKARKQADRIESTMKRAVKMWDCSEYWAQRTKGVLSNVKSKESTSTRLSRIARLEKDVRREVKYLAQSTKPENIKHYEDWIAHNTLRINYEKAILTAQGYVKPEPPKRPKPSPIANYAGENFVHLTKEQYKKVRTDSRMTKKVGFTDTHKAHRLRKVSCYDLRRMGLIEEPKNYWEMEFIFITDQKEVLPPVKEAS